LDAARRECESLVYTGSLRQLRPECSIAALQGQGAKEFRLGLARYVFSTRCGSVIKSYN
jgi:hypothetical protein